MTATHQSIHELQPFLQPPSADLLADLRHLLSRSDFTVAGVCRRVGIESIYDFRSIREGRTTATDLGDELDLLIRLFMDVDLLEHDQVQRRLPADGFAALESLGLLRRYAGDPQFCHAAVLLYPTESL